MSDDVECSSMGALYGLPGKPVVPSYASEYYYFYFSFAHLWSHCVY
jgi:hypothetical protein